VNGALATTHSFDHPDAVAADGVGGFYVSSLGRISHVVTDGQIRSVAGADDPGYSSDGEKATSYLPRGLAVDSAGNLYIADLINHRIRKVTTAGIIRTVAGNGNPGYSGDGGTATAAQLSQPYSVAVDSAGNLYITEVYYPRIPGDEKTSLASFLASSYRGFSSSRFSSFEEKL
jgi:hypothetical protein